MNQISSADPSTLTSPLPLSVQAPRGCHPSIHSPHDHFSRRQWTQHWARVYGKTGTRKKRWRDGRGEGSGGVGKGETVEVRQRREGREEDGGAEERRKEREEEDEGGGRREGEREREGRGGERSTCQEVRRKGREEKAAVVGGGDRESRQVHVAHSS